MNNPQELLKRLSDYLSSVAGQTAVITDAKPLSGGASRETWVLDVSLDGAAHQFVIRRDQPTQMFEGALTRDQEFRLMDAAYKSGVKVAKVRWSCTDPSVLGSDFFVMDYVPGISIGRRVVALPELENARQILPEQMAVELAKIHALDLAAHNIDFLSPPPAGRSPAQHSVAVTYEILDALGIKNPVWEWTLRWAERSAPACDHLTFVHGDFRIGNMLVDEKGLNAVIDWEFGHIGDPREELAFPCMRDWRFGNGHLHFAGLCDRERFLQAYEQHSGRAVDRAAVDWWEVMGNIRWGVICLSQANRHLSGADPSVELASLGRRSAEMQLETLRLIERIGF
jgi:aminoglycoside phosphotransferase (APT) family kinase protein